MHKFDEYSLFMQAFYIECGKYEPSVEDIKTLCLFFNVSADYLLGLPNGLDYPER